jgi:hypothetical protein
LSGYGIFSTCIYNITAIMFGTSRYEAQFLDDANEALSHLNIVSKFDMDFYLQYSSIDLFNGYRYSG